VDVSAALRSGFTPGNNVNVGVSPDLRWITPAPRPRRPLRVGEAGRCRCGGRGLRPGGAVRPRPARKRARTGRRRGRRPLPRRRRRTARCGPAGCAGLVWTTVIRESDGQIDISASTTELHAIADRLEQLPARETASIHADTTANPNPYRRCLAALEAQVTRGPVRVALLGDRVIVTGSAPMIRNFASCFRFPVGSQRGTHVHHEWHEGDDSIAADSLPVVVSVD
jgi:hypothetical protein